MKADAIAIGIAGVAFGLIAGYVIGNQQAGVRPAAPVVAASEPASSSSSAPPPAVLDEAKVKAATAQAEQEPSNPAPRVLLGNMYFDSENYDAAIRWYGEALKLSPRDVNVSTDLGVSYYYSNQPDKALAQFDESLKIDPNHAKTLLNMGVVRAFGKQDLAGAEQAWQQVLKVAPDSPEGQAAKRAIDSLKSAHSPSAANEAKPGA
ncbi:MAG: tetratricopeptide repeat protein [Acidobacteriaceae bacterium]|jgi:cytochrome c-type biogenesis protein CcmH/NrfG|nr:tetratricopeptide repeat protein [Acidobacteriaceae bacterium]